MYIENVDSLPLLHSAALRGDLNAIKAAIDASEFVDRRCETASGYGSFSLNVTPLMIAAGSPKSTLSTVQLLLELGADPLANSKGGASAIWYAASVDISRVQILLEAGVDPKETTSNGRSVITQAASAGRSDIVQLLLSTGASPNRESASFNVSLLPIPLVNPVGDLANLFGDNGINQDAMAFQIPLFCAAKSGSAETVNILLNAGASSTIRDYEGRTALFNASSSEVVLALLHAGCPLNTPDGYGFSELDSAVDNHYRDVIRTLVEAGASLKTTDLIDTSPLIRFCYSLEIDAEIMQLLIDLGADVHEHVYHQRTALHLAVHLTSGDQIGKLGDVVKVLVKAGLPVDVRDEELNTPLHIAVGWEGVEIGAVEALIDLGADINALNIRGETPLMVNVNNGSRRSEIIPMLLMRGADPHITLPDGRNVRDYALHRVEVWEGIVADPDKKFGKDEQTLYRHAEALAQVKQVLEIINTALHE